LPFGPTQSTCRGSARRGTARMPSCSAHASIAPRTHWERLRPMCCPMPSSKATCRSWSRTDTRWPRSVPGIPRSSGYAPRCVLAILDPPTPNSWASVSRSRHTFNQDHHPAKLRIGGEARPPRAAGVSVAPEGPEARLSEGHGPVAREFTANPVPDPDSSARPAWPTSSATARPGIPGTYHIHLEGIVGPKV